MRINGIIDLSEAKEKIFNPLDESHKSKYVCRFLISQAKEINFIAFHIHI